jgi:hypothetical protein
MPRPEPHQVADELRRIISILEDNEASVLSLEVVWRWQKDNTGSLECRIILEDLDSLTLPE